MKKRRRGGKRSLRVRWGLLTGRPASRECAGLRAMETARNPGPGARRAGPGRSGQGPAAAPRREGPWSCSRGREVLLARRRDDLRPGSGTRPSLRAAPSAWAPHPLSSRPRGAPLAGAAGPVFLAPAPPSPCKVERVSAEDPRAPKAQPSPVAVRPLRASDPRL